MLMQIYNEKEQAKQRKKYNLRRTGTSGNGIELRPVSKNINRLNIIHKLNRIK